MVSGDMYCSSSFAGNTRRYHGLLVSDNTVLLSGLHDEVNGIRLSGGWWGDTFLDGGLPYTIGASVYPVSQEFALPGCRVIRTFLFDQGLVIRYEVTGSADIRIRPLMTNRRTDTLSRDPVADVREEDGTLILNGCDITTPLSFTSDPQWYLNAYYPREQERGYESWEDLASPGFFSGTITSGVVEIRFAPHGSVICDAGISQENHADIITHAADLFFADRQIRAGYHWFVESWGRDTFISLPGLLLETGRYREAEDVFRWHLSHRNGGLLVNRYPDSYHSADATLWFFWALFQYVQHLPASPFIATIRHELDDMLHAYPRSGLVSLSGNLIRVGECSTWMDTTHTPRKGVPVEVNALWILALELAEFLKITPPVRSIDARKEFSAFWNEEAGCLYDLLEPADPTVRSNQIIALALGLVSFDEGLRALATMKEKLLTPYGLRTLAPGTPGYFGQYEGDVSCHNGMVWPWQTGFYIDALIQYGEKPADLWRILDPLWNYFLTDGAGMVPEYFEGDAPHRPGGAVCQAWSIGELIRARKNLSDRYLSET